MRLYDELMSLQPVDLSKTQFNYSEESYDLLVTSVFFNVSNVSKYLEDHSMRVEDVPSVKPPFDYSWWETSVPTGVARRHGAVAYITSWGEGVRYSISSEDYDQDIQSQMADEIYWTIWIDGRPGNGNRGGVSRLPLYEIGMPIDSLGRPFVRGGEIVGRDLPSNPLLHLRSGPRSYQSLLEFERSGRSSGFSVAEFRKGQVSKAIRYLWPFLVAIGFSHCKNVDMVEAPEIPYKIRRKRERKLGRPLAQFKELVIDPSASQKLQASQAAPLAGERRAKALHIARGHFAHYTEDKPLFGKYTGTFWRPAHVRGSAEVGTVYKDYKVKPPKS